MSREQRTETPLSHVIDEIRREPVPSIDWDTVENSLMAEAGRVAMVRPKRAAAFSPKWSFALAACAFGLGAFVFSKPQVRAPQAAATHVEVPAPAVTGKLDGNALEFGAHVTADAEDVVVEHSGHVTWTLSKGSSAHLESVGEVVALSLDRGIVAAKVVKSLRPETFVVRVDRSRIAVHGTEFRVERLATGVRVQVTEGVLGIGPVGGPSFELHAPGAAMLNLDGARTDSPKAASAPAARHASVVATEAPRQPEQAAAAVDPTPEAAAPIAAAPAPIAAAPGALPKKSAPPPGTEPLVAQAAKAIQRCFATHTLAGGDLHVSVMTKMALRVTTDGRVGDALFEPPLAPSVRDCVDREVGALRFPSSPDGFEAARHLELVR